ncbi:MAG: hypothetical protein GY761_11300 [Hyphomicrobiales bacterium]|nr:hypothetical protein [Hyphomicrobiales bacterium]
MNAKRRSGLARMKEKQSQLRANLFPDLDENFVWDVKNRSKTKGYSSMPRTMPLIGAIMDALSGKGKPVSTTYLELWCRSNEQCFLTLSKPHETAFASGYSGERGVSTWKERVRRLEALKFISTKPGPSGDLNYVQIWNPYLVIKQHMQDKTESFPENYYHALLERSLDIGALDLLDEDDD